MKDMLDKIIQIEKRYIELGETLSDPAVIQDYNKFRDLSIMLGKKLLMLLLKLNK